MPAIYHQFQATTRSATTPCVGAVSIPSPQPLALAMDRLRNERPMPGHPDH